MRFSLHQQNYKPNSTAGRHKPGGIDLAGASHPQLPKAQCARDASHNPSALCGVCGRGWVWLPREALVAESTGHTVQHHSPSRQAHTESKGLSKHLQSCTQLCQMQAAHHSHQRGTQAGLQPLQETKQLSSESSLPKANWWGLTDRVLLSSAQMASGGTENQLVLSY